MNIKEIRQLTDCSQSEFARQLGIPVRTLQQWEQGRSEPPEYLLELIQFKAGTMIAEDDHFLDQFRLKPVTEWKVFIDSPFKNCNKVHPLQQRKVAALLSEIAGNPLVKKVLIFGSSVTNRCHIGSDVDIYLEMTKDVNPFQKEYDFEFDFWNNFRVDSRLIQEIEKKGVVVYGE